MNINTLTKGQECKFSLGAPNNDGVNYIHGNVKVKEVLPTRDSIEFEPLEGCNHNLTELVFSTEVLEALLSDGRFKIHREMAPEFYVSAQVIRANNTADGLDAEIKLTYRVKDNDNTSRKYGAIVSLQGVDIELIAEGQEYPRVLI